MPTTPSSAPCDEIEAARSAGRIATTLPRMDVATDVAHPQLPNATRLADGTFEVELGLGPLAPGEYVIEIVGESGSEKTQNLLAIRVTP